jgi:hypothetical protein
MRALLQGVMVQALDPSIDSIDKSSYSAAEAAAFK